MGERSLQRNRTVTSYNSIVRMLEERLKIMEEKNPEEYMRTREFFNKKGTEKIVYWIINRGSKYGGAGKFLDEMVELSFNGIKGSYEFFTGDNS